MAITADDVITAGMGRDVGLSVEGCCGCGCSVGMKGWDWDRGLDTKDKALGDRVEIHECGVVGGCGVWRREWRRGLGVVIRLEKDGQTGYQTWLWGWSGLVGVGR